MTAPDAQKPTILLAEDSDDDAFFFERAFGKAALSCGLLRAGNGKLAVELLNRLASRVPFLIFLDLKMPVMSGFDVLEWLRISGISPMPAVIVLSGSNDLADRARAFGLGALDYLVKPVAAETLRERVQGVIRTRETLDAPTGVRT